MEIITNESEIAKCQQLFKESLESLAESTKTVSLGFQSGQFECKVFWIPSLDLWAHFGFPPGEKSPGERYWNAFGFGEPSGQTSINCEINPPIRGIKRGPAGVFLKDSGNIFLGHRGNINARGRVPQEFFFSNSTLSIVNISDGNRISRIALIGNMKNTEFPKHVRDFVREIIRIKTLYREIN